MDTLSLFTANNFQDDPILQMFLQSKENKDLALDFLNQESLMEDLKTEFTHFYILSINAVDNFFLNELQMESQSPLKVDSPIKQDESQTTKGGRTSSEKISSCLKRLKLSEDEYVEKLLIDFGYESDPIFESVCQVHKKVLPIMDKRIQVKLENPKAHITRDFPSACPPSQEAHSFACKAQKLMSIPSATSTKKQDLQLIQKQSNTSYKKDLHRINETECSHKTEVSKELQGICISNATTLLETHQQYEAFSPDIDSQFDQLQKQLPKICNLQQALAPQFENINLEYTGPLQTNEDKKSTETFEELISSIHHFSPAKLQAQKIEPALNVPIANENQPKAVLSNQVHQILYSKPFTLQDYDSEADEEEFPKKESKRNSVSYSFDDPLDEKSDSLDFPFENQEQYDLTDYSDNSSSNENSYAFHEELESLDGPLQKPPMFNFFNTTNFNINDQSSKIRDQEAVNNNGDCINSQSNSSSTLINNNTGFAGFGSQYSNNENTYEYDGSQNTMMIDYMFYLNQQNSMNNHKQNDGLDSNDGTLKDKKVLKLDGSPVKHKVTRLYCNRKRIPVWAANMKEVERISRSQKDIFHPTRIFGYFNIDNLDLVDVFQRRDHRFLKPRGSSANWKNEPHTPSTSKPSSGKNMNAKEVVLSKTKKNIDFKSFF